MNCIFKLLGSPSPTSWPAYTSLPALRSGLTFVEVHTINLGPDGSLVQEPRSSLRRNFPPEGREIKREMVPGTALGRPGGTHRTTSLSESGFAMLSSLLCCDPSKRASAADALRSDWFGESPPAAPLSRGEIRQLRRHRDEAIASGAHSLSIAQQRAQTAAKMAGEKAAAIAAQLRGAGIALGPAGGLGDRAI